MTAKELTPEQLERIAHGLGLHEARDYAELVDAVETWPAPTPPRSRRHLRRVVADYALLAIAGVWMIGMGGVVGVVRAIDKAGGKKK